MTVDVAALDAHEQPSDELRAVWKSFSKAGDDGLATSSAIDDLQVPEKAAGFKLHDTIPSAVLNKAFSDFAQDDSCHVQVDCDAPIYYHPILPGAPSSLKAESTQAITYTRLGLLVLPSLIPPEIQTILLSRLIHRDLSNPKHQTNMHLHFKLPYPDPSRSFFSHSPDSPTKFEPKDLSVHKPLSVKQVLDRKLHWMTLGGQYDWTNRIYPSEKPPPFPPDIAGLLGSLFPETLAQAAIVNFYTPGDTMMMHRDVSEETDKGLVSISMGCDCLFMIAPSDIGKAPEGQRPKDAKQYILLRLRSGDAIYMAKDARFAWHGVPKVLKGTCPEHLENWPAEGGMFEEWRGWMSNKRINLNVRQMRD